MVIYDGFNDDQVGDNAMVFNREAVQFYDCIFFLVEKMFIIRPFVML